MAAANTDLLRKTARKWVGQIGAGGVSDDTTTTIPLASTTNLPTDTAVTLVIDRVDSNGTKTPSLEETVVGVVSGSNIINAVRGVEGTAQAHDAGDVVELLWTNDNWNDTVDWALVQHLQDGNHGDVCATSLTLIGAATTEEITSSSDVIASAVIADSVTARTTNANLDLASNGTGSVEFQNAATFASEVDDGNSSTADTIDWRTGNKHKSTVTGDCTYTFTAPSGPANLILKLVNAGAQTLTWPGTVTWPGGTEPSWTSSGTDIVAFYYDGTNYHGVSSLDMQ